MTTTIAHTVSDREPRAQRVKLAGNRPVDLQSTVPDPAAIAKVPVETARRHGILPLAFDESEERLSVVVSQTSDLATTRAAMAKLDAGLRVDFLHSDPQDIKSAIETFYRYELSLPGILQELEQGRTGDARAAVENGDIENPIVRLVNAILSNAVECGASAIHLEPESDYLRVRYRIDGVLQQVLLLDLGYWQELVLRLKSISAIDSSDTTMLKRGGIAMTISARRFHLSVACYSSIHGENAVLQLKEWQKGVVALEDIGLRTADLASLRLMMARPDGIVVVTGPTRSGKTTTLYSMLNYRNDESVNIVTFEDEVQFTMPKIRQLTSQCDSQPGLARFSRSAMWLDPDIILIDELQDLQTAQMILRAAIAGQQVYASVCARSALDAVARLADLGVDRQQVARNIIGIVAQRLLRRLCITCKQPYVPDETECRILGVDRGQSSTLYREAGCEVCDFRGYFGQIGIFEVLTMNEDLGELVSRGVTHKELRSGARRAGFEELAKHAIRHVIDGVTSLSEISRVVDLTSRLR